MFKEMLGGLLGRPKEGLGASSADKSKTLAASLPHGTSLRLYQPPTPSTGMVEVSDQDEVRENLGTRRIQSKPFASGNDAKFKDLSARQAVQKAGGMTVKVIGSTDNGDQPSREDKNL